MHGIRFSVGSRNNTVGGNTFQDNEGYDVYQYSGNDPTVEVEDGYPTSIVYFGNTFGGNTGGARLDDSMDTQFVSNMVHEWGDFEMRDSENTLILGNTFPVDMSYTSSASCINSASDVPLEDICDNAANTKPFDQSDYTNMVVTAGGEAASVITTTQSPSGSPTIASSTLPPTVAPTASFRPFITTSAPSVVPRDAILTSDSYSDYNDCSEGHGSKAFNSVSPTPSYYARSIPVTETDDNLAQESNDSASLFLSGSSRWIGVALVAFFAM